MCEVKDIIGAKKLYNPTKRLDKRSRLRIKINKRTKLIAGFMMVFLISSVGAVIYSNSLEGTFSLTATYPIRLSWESGIAPFTSNAFSGIAYTSNMIIENLGDANIDASAWYMFISIVGPSGTVPNDVIVILNGATLVFTGTSTIECTKVIVSEFTAHLTFTWAFSLQFKTSALVGDYAVTIYAGLV